MRVKKRKRHGPEEIVRKLRDEEAMMTAGKDLAAVLPTLEVSEATYNRWRNRAPMPGVGPVGLSRKRPSG